MRLFKYLVFIFSFFFSSSIFAYPFYGTGNAGSVKGKTYSSFSQAESDYVSYMKSQYGYPYPSWMSNQVKCIDYNSGVNCWIPNAYVVFADTLVPPLCPYPDYKIVTQGINTLKSKICVPMNGSMCAYTTSANLKKTPVINGQISNTFSSVSSTPDPNCKEVLLDPPCDPSNPYGGCYTPPNQECTRQHNGSIVCPEEKDPEIEQGCNGADYCSRPPQGCGVGYVSGTYNGERICVKASKPSDTPPDDPDSPQDPNKSVVDSIKELKDTFEHYFKETIESIGSATKSPPVDDNINLTANVEVNVDMSETNAKIDETNGILTDIKDWLTEDVDEGSLDVEMPDDIVLSKRSFSDTLFGSRSSCPSDHTLSMTLFTGQSFKHDFSFQLLCDKLSIIGALILIFAYYQAVMIVVRAS